MYQGTFHFPYLFLTRSFLGNIDIEERDILKYLEPPLLEVIGTFNMKI